VERVTIFFVTVSRASDGDVFGLSISTDNSGFPDEHGNFRYLTFKEYH